MSGSVLLSHKVTRAVPSTLRGFRVRNGTGCFPLAMTAETLLRYNRPYLGNRTVDASAKFLKEIFIVLNPRPISTGQLHGSLRFHFRPINPVVFWGPYLVNQWETSS